MTRSLAACAGLVIVLVTAAGSPASAFWQRGQVSMCADATSPAERARHRCDELLGYVDPGWPALGLGGIREKGYRAPQHAPSPRAPVRRLG